MKMFLNSDSVEEACQKVSGLDIYNNPAATEVFCQVAIKYSRHELRRKGIDLFTVASFHEVRKFCGLWLSEHKSIEPENALIALAWAIQANAVASSQTYKTPS